MGLIQNKVTVSQPNSHVIIKNAGGLRGLTGEQGVPGPQGDPGEAATVTAGTTTTLPAGSDATVQNVGSTSDAIFNFGIPQGEKGDTGDTGAAATIEVGSTTTLPTGQDATVTNSGTSSAAIFNFGIPRGIQGEEGPQGFSPSASVSKTGDTATITITDKDGTTTAQITDGVTPTVDDELSPTSENPVQNKIVTNALAGKQPSFQIVDELPAEGVEGSEYLVDEAYETITQLQGDTKQQTYAGFQLIQKDGMATPLSDSDFWSSVGNLTSEDLGNGWARFKSTSSSGTHNCFTKYAAFQWEVSTTYTVIVELKNVPLSGNGGMTLTQPQNASDPFATTSAGGEVKTTFAGEDGTVVFTGVTKSSVTTNGLRSYFTSGFTTNNTVDVRVTIVKGDHSSDWQNYAGDNWQPYVGGTASPNPDYPQEVQTVTGRQVVTISDGDSQSQEYEVNLGKNLCDGINQEYWLTSTATGAGVSSNNSGLIIPIEQNTSYTISTTSSQSRYRVAFSDQTYQGSQFNCYNGANRDGTSDSITSNSGNHKYLIVNATNLTNIQVEKGSTATTYASYFTPIELCKIGDYQDYIYKSGDDWYVHKAIGEVDLDGTTEGTWTYLSDAGHERFVVNYSDIALQSPYAADTPKIQYCQYFEGSNGYHTYTGDLDNIISGHHNNHQIVIRATKYTSLSAFTTWLSTTKPAVYYALATATDTQITDSALIAQLDALNAVAIKHYDTVAVSSPNLPASLVLVQGANSHLEPYVYYNGKFEKVQIV